MRYYSAAVLRFFFILSLLLISVDGVASAEGTASTDEPPGEVEEVSDPLEGFNRGVWWFNDRFDRYVFQHVADGYDYIMPDRVQDSISNFFYNLKYPVRLLSDVFQFKLSQAGVHTGRFLVNSTLGLGGLFDVAAEFGLQRHDEDLGLAFAYHGVPAGPYLVLPFLGPSNLRDAIGYAGEMAMSPMYWIPKESMSTGDADKTEWSLLILYAVNTRAQKDEAIQAMREAAVDEYLFQQGAYYQYRAGLLYDGNVKANSLEEDLEEDFLDEEF